MVQGCGLFVDLDGTLADSLSVMRHVYHRFLTDRDRPADDAEFDRLNGPPLADVVAHLAQSHDLTMPLVELVADYWRLIGEAYDGVVPMAGAAALLAAAQDHGMPVVLVTSNDAGLAARWLDRVGLAVDAIIGGGDVTHGKPDPEPYLRALAQVGCQPQRSFAVEDSPSGVAAARAAGLTVYHFGDGDWQDLAAIAADLRRRVAS